MDYREQCEKLLSEWETERDSYRNTICNPTAYYKQKGDSALKKKMREDGRVYRKQLEKEKKVVKYNIPKPISQSTIKRVLKNYKNR